MAEIQELPSLQEPTTGSYATQSLSSGVNTLIDTYQGYLDDLGIKFNVSDYVAFHSDPINNVEAGKRLISYTNVLDKPTKSIVENVLSAPKLNKTDLASIKYLMQDTLTRNTYFVELEDYKRKELIDAFANNNYEAKPIQSKTIPDPLKKGAQVQMQKVKTEVTVNNIKGTLANLKNQVQDTIKQYENVQKELNKQTKKDTTLQTNIADTLKSGKDLLDKVNNIENKINTKQPLTQDDIKDLNKSLEILNQKATKTDSGLLKSKMAETITSVLFDVSENDKTAGGYLSRGGSHAIIGMIQKKHAIKEVNALKNIIQQIDGMYRRDDIKQDLWSRIYDEFKDKNSILYRTLYGSQVKTKEEFEKTYSNVKDYIQHNILRRYLDEQKMKDPEALRGGNVLFDNYVKYAEKSVERLNKEIVTNIREKMMTKEGKDIIEEFAKEYRNVIVPMADYVTSEESFKYPSSYSLAKGGIGSEKYQEQLTDKEKEAKIKKYLEKDIVPRLKIKDEFRQEIADKFSDALAYLKYITDDSFKKRFEKAYTTKSNIYRESLLLKMKNLGENITEGAAMTFSLVDEDYLTRQTIRRSYDGDESWRLANSVANGLGSIGGFAVLGWGIGSTVGLATRGLAGLNFIKNIGNVIAATRAYKAISNVKKLQNVYSSGLNILNKTMIGRGIVGTTRGAINMVMPYALNPEMSAGAKLMAFGMHNIMTALEAKLEASGYFGGFGVEKYVEEEALRHRVVSNFVDPQYIQRYSLETYLKDKSTEEKVKDIRKNAAFWSNYALLFLTNNMTIDGIIMNKAFNRALKIKPYSELSDPGLVKYFKLGRIKGIPGRTIKAVSPLVVYSRYYGRNAAGYAVSQLVEAGQEVGQEIISSSAEILDVYPVIRDKIVNDYYNINTKSTGTFFDVFRDAKSYNNVIRANSEALEEVFVSTLISSAIFSGATGFNNVIKNHQKVQKNIGRANRIINSLTNNEIGALGVSNTGGVFLEDNTLGINHSQLGKLHTLFGMLGEISEDKNQNTQAKMLGIMKVLGKFSDFSNFASIFDNYTSEAKKAIEGIETLDDMIRFIEVQRTGAEITDENLQTIKNKLYNNIYTGDEFQNENREQLILEDIKKQLISEYDRTNNYIKSYEETKQKVLKYFENKHGKTKEQLQKQIYESIQNITDLLGKTIPESKLKTNELTELLLHALDGNQQILLKEIAHIKATLENENDLKTIWGELNIDIENGDMILNENSLNTLKEVYTLLTGETITENKDYISVDSVMSNNNIQQKEESKRYVVKTKEFISNIIGSQVGNEEYGSYLYLLLTNNKLNKDEIVKLLKNIENNADDYKAFFTTMKENHELLNDYTIVDDLTYFIASDKIKEDAIDDYINGLDIIKKLTTPNKNNIDAVKSIMGAMDDVAKLQEIINTLEVTIREKETEIKTLIESIIPKKYKDEKLLEIDESFKKIRQVIERLKLIKSKTSAVKEYYDKRENKYDFNESISQQMESILIDIKNQTSDISKLLADIDKGLEKVKTILDKQQVITDIGKATIIGKIQNEIIDLYNIYNGITYMLTQSMNNSVENIPVLTSILSNIDLVFKQRHKIDDMNYIVSMYFIQDILNGKDVDINDVFNIEDAVIRTNALKVYIYKWMQNVLSGKEIKPYDIMELLTAIKLHKEDILANPDNQKINISLLDEFVLNPLFKQYELLVPDNLQAIDDETLKKIKEELVSFLDRYKNEVSEIQTDLKIFMLQQNDSVATIFYDFANKHNNLIKETEANVNEIKNTISKIASKYQNKIAIVDLEQMYLLYRYAGEYIESKDMNISERVKNILDKERKLYEYIINGLPKKEETEKDKKKPDNKKTSLLEKFRNIFKRKSTENQQTQETQQPDTQVDEKSKKVSSTFEEFIMNIDNEILKIINKNIDLGFIKYVKRHGDPSKIEPHMAKTYRGHLKNQILVVVKEVFLAMESYIHDPIKLKEIDKFKNELFGHLNFVLGIEENYGSGKSMVNKAYEIFKREKLEKMRGKFEEKYPFVGEGFNTTISLDELGIKILNSFSKYEFTYEVKDKETKKQINRRIAVFEYDSSLDMFVLNESLDEAIYKLTNYSYEDAHPGKNIDDEEDTDTGTEPEKTSSGPETENAITASSKGSGSKAGGGSTAYNEPKKPSIIFFKKDFKDFWVRSLAKENVELETKLEKALDGLLDNIIAVNGKDNILSIVEKYIIPLGDQNLSETMRYELEEQLNKIYADIMQKQMVGTNMKKLKNKQTKFLYETILKEKQNKGTIVSILLSEMEYDESSGIIYDLEYIENLQKKDKEDSILNRAKSIIDNIKSIDFLSQENKGIVYKDINELVEFLELYKESKTVDAGLVDALMVLIKNKDLDKLDKDIQDKISILMDELSDMVAIFKKTNTDKSIIDVVISEKLKKLGYENVIIEEMDKPYKDKPVIFEKQENTIRVKVFYNGVSSLYFDYVFKNNDIKNAFEGLMKDNNMMVLIDKKGNFVTDYKVKPKEPKKEKEKEKTEKTKPKSGKQKKKKTEYTPVEDAANLNLEDDKKTKKNEPDTENSVTAVLNGKTEIEEDKTNIEAEIQNMEENNKEYTEERKENQEEVKTIINIEESKKGHYEYPVNIGRIIYGNIQDEELFESLDMLKTNKNLFDSEVSEVISNGRHVELINLLEAKLLEINEKYNKSKSKESRKIFIDFYNLKNSIINLIKEKTTC